MHLDYFAQWKIYNKCLLNVCYYYSYSNYIPENSIQLCRTGNYKFIVSDSNWTFNHVAVWLFLMCYLAWTQANTNSLPIISISHKWKCQAFTTIHKPLIHLTSLLLIDHLASCTSKNRDHQAVTPLWSYLLCALFLLLFQQRTCSSSCRRLSFLIMPPLQNPNHSTTSVPLQFFPVFPPMHISAQVSHIFTFRRWGPKHSFSFSNLSGPCFLNLIPHFHPSALCSKASFRWQFSWSWSQNEWIYF